MADSKPIQEAKKDAPKSLPSDLMGVSDEVKLSDYTQALISSLSGLKQRPQPDDISKIIVSQTVSFMAIVYEKLRNVVEYREEHLVRRAAIERIIKRRLTLNPDGVGEAENLVRELLWARYFPNGSLGEEDTRILQEIIDKYIRIKKHILAGRTTEHQKYLWQFLLELMTCEIEETLTPVESARDASFTYFIYQTLRHKVKIEGLTDEQKDTFFLIAIEKAFLKSDIPYQRYHLFITFYKMISKTTPEDLDTLTPQLPNIFKKIDEHLHNRLLDKLNKYVSKQLPPFLILFDILKRKKNEMKSLLASREKLWVEVERTCREKYQQVGKRLRNLAIRSLIYIFLTKMLFALILEYPISIYLYGNAHIPSIVINSLFPPFLMLVIVLFFHLPDEENTKKIYQRIIEIIDFDKNFETRVAYITSKSRIKRPILVLGFSIVYSFTFFLTLFFIYEILTFLKFNLVSQAIFLFFVSVVSFFSYRIRALSNEYRLVEKSSIFTPIVDFFFLPILAIGKFLSSEVARFNFFKIIFDFIIEAPFKFIIQVIEEWISFIRQRKEEIV